MKKTHDSKTWLAAALLLLLPIVGCDEPMEPEPVPTTVHITPDMVELLSSGAQTGLNAVVRDQDGKAMPDASVTWASSDAAVFTIEGNGLIATVTAVANGEGTVTATAGQASGTASVTVIQTPARMEVVSGNDQEALRNTALPQPLVVRVVELTGGVVPGVVINFAPVDEGSGSVSPAEATTGADGTASTMWTLGAARNQRVTASVADPELVAGFGANATADPPIPDYTFVGGLEASRLDPLDDETIDVMMAVTNLGDGAAPFTIQMTVGGTPSEAVEVAPVAPGDTATITVTMGPLEVGEHPVAAMIDPDGDVEEWDDENNGSDLIFVTSLAQPQAFTFGESVTMDQAGGTLQLFRIDVEEQVNQAFTVTFTGGSGDGDIFVDYGTRGGSTIGTRFQARCYSWAGGNNENCQFYPAREGSYYLALHAWSAFAGATLSIGPAEPADPFDLEIVLVDGGGTASQNGVIAQVEARYESMMAMGGFDATISMDEDQCAPGIPEVSGHAVDDVAIWVVIGPLDGAGNAVAASGSCIYFGGLSGWVGLRTFVGAVVLDEADIGQLESDGALEAVVTREMARALGFNPFMFSVHGFLQNPSLPERPEADTHMNAPLVVAAFNDAGGADYAGGKVPLESGALEPISDQYWRASVFGDEIMTPYVTGDSQPLSRITLEALYEVHVGIDPMMADAFSLSSARFAGPRGANKYYSIDLAAYRSPVRITVQDPVKRK